MQSRLPTLPTKQVKVDQVMLYLVTHYSFQPTCACIVAQNFLSMSALGRNRMGCQKTDLNCHMHVASNLNEIASRSLANCPWFVSSSQYLHMATIQGLPADNMVRTPRIKQPENSFFMLYAAC